MREKMRHKSIADFEADIDAMLRLEWEDLRTNVKQQQTRRVEAEL